MQAIKTLSSGRTSLEEALAVFDEAEAVPLHFMTGLWRGREVQTGHRLNGVLQAAGWFGKWFLDENRVHPLLFFNRRKNGIFAVNPALVPLWITPPKTAILHTLLTLARPLLETSKPRARLQMMNIRGKHTATMCYDDKPIHDAFAKLDDNTVLGMMERKGEREPFFFLLERSDGNHGLSVPPQLLVGA